MISDGEQSYYEADLTKLLGRLYVIAISWLNHPRFWSNTALLEQIIDAAEAVASDATILLQAHRERNDAARPQRPPDA